MKEYLPVAHVCTKRKIDANALRIEVSYTLGGMNFFTYQNEPRGYYLHVSPVNRSVVDGIAMESFTLFTGAKHLLLACDRRSKKREQEAEVIAKTQREMLINHMLQKYDLRLAEAAVSA